MKKRISFNSSKAAFLAGVFLTGSMQAFGQDSADSLFSSEIPLQIGLSFSIKELKNTNGDSAWVSQKLYYTTDAGVSDSIKVDIKSRGHFRLNNCYYPPLWIKIKGKDAKGTVFEGNKKLKLVVPCDNLRNSNALILREYLCYKLCEMITPFVFRTRLVNIDLKEQRGKKDKNVQLKGILLEDFEKVAKRYDAEEEKNAIIPWALQDTSALRLYLFELLIANTDWSAAAQHNVKVIRQPGDKFIPFAYDFDMSGVVNAPYSFVSMAGDAVLPIDKVTERLYRGYCMSPEVTQFVRNEMLAKKAKILSATELLKDELDDKEIRDIRKYLDDFFDILSSDFLFRTKVLEQCRK